MLCYIKLDNPHNFFISQGVYHKLLLFDNNQSVKGQITGVGPTRYYFLEKYISDVQKVLQ